MERRITTKLESDTNNLKNTGAENMTKNIDYSNITKHERKQQKQTKTTFDVWATLYVPTN